MANSLAVPAITGLATGVALIILFSLAFKTMAILTMPSIPQQQAIDIAARDLTTKYIRSPDYIKIYAIVGHQNAAYIPIEDFTEKRLVLYPLFYVSPVGKFVINATTHVPTKCYSPYCPIPATSAVEGRLTWIVELFSACKYYPEHDTIVQYAIDAQNGEILWHRGSEQPEEAFACQ